MTPTERTLRSLADFYPRVFKLDPRSVQPLMSSIDNELRDLIGTKVGQKNLSNALSTYRQSRAYQRALANGKGLLNIDGSVGRFPTADEIAVASTWLNEHSIEHCLIRLMHLEKGHDDWKYAVFLLENDLRELKTFASIKARQSATSSAHAARRSMLLITQTLNKFDPKPGRDKDLSYIQYYDAISALVLGILENDFDTARRYLRIALHAAKRFENSTYFFPNYFYSLADIVSHTLIIDALEAFSRADFLESSSSFLQWLDTNSSRKNTGEARYDGVLFSHLLSQCLHDEFAERTPDWNSVRDCLNSPSINIYRNYRALWDRIEPIAMQLERGSLNHTQRATLREELSSISSEWRYLALDVPLQSPQERSASLEEPVRLPAVLDLFDIIPSSGDKWRFILSQVLRHSLILLCDYYSKFHSYLMGRNSLGVVPLHRSYEIEKMSEVELLAYLNHVEAGNLGAASIRLRALELWGKARSDAQQAPQAVAMQSAQTFFNVFRSNPHVVRVVSDQTPERHKVMFNPKRQILLSREWRHMPSRLIVDTRTELNEGNYAYMRPRWNRSLKGRYRLDRRQDDRLIPARVPVWMTIFERWSRGYGAVPKERFLDWVEQIEPRRRATALRLLSRVRFYSEDQSVQLWKDMFGKVLPVDARSEGTLIIPLGGLHKSGTHNLYFLEQALSGVPKKDLGFNPTGCFARITDLGDRLPPSVVFVDDLLGTGNQMARYVRKAIEAAPQLRNAKLFVASKVGFRSAIKNLKTETDGLNIRIYCTEILEDSDRAFQYESGTWDSVEDLEEARQWCRLVGECLIHEKGMDAKRDALGYFGSEALVSFGYNTPNNTLPIFWGTGEYRGRPWGSLLDRR